jgi:hypothetical protein
LVWGSQRANPNRSRRSRARTMGDHLAAGAARAHAELGGEVGDVDVDAVGVAPEEEIEASGDQDGSGPGRVSRRPRRRGAGGRTRGAGRGRSRGRPAAGGPGGGAGRVEEARQLFGGTGRGWGGVAGPVSRQASCAAYVDLACPCGRRQGLAVGRSGLSSGERSMRFRAWITHTRRANRGEPAGAWTGAGVPRRPAAARASRERVADPATQRGAAGASTAAATSHPAPMTHGRMRFGAPARPGADCNVDLRGALDALTPSRQRGEAVGRPFTRWS